VGKVSLADGEAACTASARVLARGGADEKTGEHLPAAMVAERVAWCIALVRDMAARMVEGHWNAADMTALASGADASGRPLPGQAWMALRRLGWGAAPPGGVAVNDRVIRMAQEQAGRVLRSACWRAGLVTAIVKTWPQDPGRRTPGEWDAVRAAVPGGEHVPSSVIRARTRQVSRFLGASGRMPADLFELEGPPNVPGLLILAACDRQQTTIERHDADPGRALLRVQLPVRPDPRDYRDWTWVTIPLILPPTVPAGAVLHLPTLRIPDGRVRAEVAFTRAVPRPRRDGHAVALALDWGLNTLLSAGAARLHPDGRICVLGSGAQYRANGVLAKAHRLRRHGEQVQAKFDHYGRLAGSREDHPLAGRKAVLGEEARRVSERRSNLNNALAWSAARWAVDQAIAAGATVIYVEDLRTLEARGMGKTMNVRLSQAVRGQVAGRIRDLAAGHGIAVVTVPARGTSKYCPRCLAPLRHCKAPDKPAVPGWKWASCPGCGWQGDRDQGAWQRIAAHGLAHQAKTSTDRGRGTMIIRTVDDEKEATAVVMPQAPGRDRSKSGPTPRRTTSRRVPRRRVAPSPARPSSGAGQRPEGHATTARPLPRAASRDQGATTTSTTPVRRPHRARGAALGAGFHLHAHATPPRREPTLSTTRSAEDHQAGQRH
jgi:hypothetical protein